MSNRLHDLAAVPLDQLLSKALERLRRASLDELAELLGRSTASAVPLAPSGDAIARAVLALPGTVSKLRTAERAVIMYALDACKGNVSAAGRLLGLDRKSLERKIRRIRGAT